VLAVEAKVVDAVTGVNSTVEFCPENGAAAKLNEGPLEVDIPIRDELLDMLLADSADPTARSVRGAARGPIKSVIALVELVTAPLAAA
jgi:hypothetical protein